MARPVGLRPLAEPWWECCSGIMRFSPKARGETIRHIIDRLDEVRDWGLDAVEIFAPYYGGDQYNGLDVRDYYRVDPAIGTMEDLIALRDACHERGMPLVLFLNMGYGAMDFPAFLQACDDIRAGIDSAATHWFLWSDTGEEEMDKSLAPYFMNDVHGHWRYSERAGKYYWVKWRGQKGNVELPQFNFGDPVVQEEVRRAIEYWMQIGVDGMIVDAVNWYIGCNWHINNATMTDVIRRYPNKYIQPEGAGGFEDDPVKWITEGHYNSVQDYGLGIWWTFRDIIGDAIRTGDPSRIEPTLQSYRDRVVAAGGVTYAGPMWGRNRKGGTSASYAQMVLEAACVATVGELYHASEDLLTLNWPEIWQRELRQVLRTLQAHPALQAAGHRQKITTNDDRMYYAFLRRAKMGDEEMLGVLNFQNEPRQIRVGLNGSATLEEVLTGKRLSVDAQLITTLPAYGYAFYQIERS